MPESEKSQSLESLFAQLTSFSLEQDAEFRRGDNDFVTRTRKVGRCVGSVYDEDQQIELPIYNEEIISFTAERVPSAMKNGQTIPGRFTVGLETVTAVDNVPPAVRPYIDSDIIEVYDETEPGDLYVSFYVEYIVEHAYDSTVDITRNMQYTLYDNDETLYQTSEADETNKYERVPIASDQKTLLVHQPIEEEAVADQAEQLQFNVLFEDMFDGSNQEFYMAFLTAREQDAILSIKALIRSLKVGASTPTL